MYKLTFFERALVGIKRLRQSEPSACKKLIGLLEELKEHPRSGTGKVERLEHEEGEVWSRRITQKHRLVYRIREQEIEVVVISTYGHYKN